MELRCPLYPRKLPLLSPTFASAKGHKQSPAPQRMSSLFNHLIDAAHQGQRNIQTERLRGPEIDDQLDVRSLLDRQVVRLLVLRMRPV